MTLSKYKNYKVEKVNVLSVKSFFNLIKKELEKCSQQDWEAGEKTAGSHASIVKNNLQLNRNTEVSKKKRSISY